jgi:hypothetical protein
MGKVGGDGGAGNGNNSSIFKYVIEQFRFNDGETYWINRVK